MAVPFFQYLGWYNGGEIQMTGATHMTIPSWAIGAIVALISLAFTAAGFFYSKVRTAEAKAKDEGRLIEKLDGLEKKVDRINNANDVQNEKCGLRGERLALVEASVKSAHHRIDEFNHLFRKAEQS